MKKIFLLLTILSVLTNSYAQEVLKTITATNEPLPHSNYKVGDVLHVIGISDILHIKAQDKDKYKLAYYLNDNKTDLQYDWIFRETLDLSDEDFDLFMSKREYFKQLDEAEKAAKQQAKQQAAEAKAKAEEDARIALEARLKNVRDNYKNGILIDYGIFQNTAGGYHPQFALLNNTEKTIKYVDVYFKVYNSVGDVCVIKYQEGNVCKIRGTGPIAPGDQANYTWPYPSKATHYSDMAGSDMRITKMVLIYTDGTSKTVTTNFVLDPDLRKYVYLGFYPDESYLH